MASKITAVLVHGAWADGSSWSKVIPRLEDADIRAVAVQLPLTSLEDDVATVKRALALVEGQAVLVGHSYGGVVITEVGNDAKVKALVYIAAFAPDAGESAGSLGASVPPSPMGAEIRPDAQGFLSLTREGVFNGFAQDLTDLEKRILFAAQSPTNGKAFGGNVSTPAWRSKKSWYLVATEDRAIQPELERKMAKHIGATVVSVPTSHVAMLSHPKEVASLIADAVAKSA
jgi:pimeloyl-ACP methyl ester carboxylesterase